MPQGTFNIPAKIGVTVDHANVDYYYGPWASLTEARKETSVIQEDGLTVAVREAVETPDADATNFVNYASAIREVLQDVLVDNEAGNSTYWNSIDMELTVGDMIWSAREGYFKSREETYTDSGVEYTDIHVALAKTLTLTVGGYSLTFDAVDATTFNKLTTNPDSPNYDDYDAGMIANLLYGSETTAEIEAKNAKPIVSSVSLVEYWWINGELIKKIASDGSTNGSENSANDIDCDIEASGEVRTWTKTKGGNTSSTTWNSYNLGYSDTGVNIGVLKSEQNKLYVPVPEVTLEQTEHEGKNGGDSWHVWTLKQGNNEVKQFSTFSLGFTQTGFKLPVKTDGSAKLYADLSKFAQGHKTFLAYWDTENHLSYLPDAWLDSAGEGDYTNEFGGEEYVLIGRLAVRDGFHCDTSATINGSVTANHFYSSSDRRLKDDIEDAEIELEDIDKIPVVNFHFKGKDGWQLGTIAQDVQDLFPELVNEDKDGYLSVDYSMLACVAVAGVKKLKEENRTLQDKMLLMEQTTDILLRRIDMLEKRIK